MKHNSHTASQRISAFLARKAEQHPDVFDEHEFEDEVSPAEVHTLQIAYA